MASRQPGAWGIDIGQSALKALRLELINGVPTATAFDYVEHPKILSQPDADPDLLTREALEKFLSRNSLKGDVVCISVAGQSGLARFVKLPPVEEKKISDIVKFEAKQQIPFPLEEVVWDYQKIGSGVVTDGFAMETEIGLFAIKRENVSRTMQHFQEVNVEVDTIQMAPLALCNYVSYDLLKKDANTVSGEEKGKKQCVVALDIGVETSALVITDGDRVIWQRPIPIGGNRFTRALTKDLKLTFAKAEHLKKNATKSPDLKRILLALRADLNEFVNEVQKSLAFFTNTHRDAHVQYMVGMGAAFRLPGLQKYLQEKLQLDVRKLSKFQRLAGDSVIAAPVFNDNLMSMGVTYGLALQGLKLARLHTNLLPQEIRTERLVRSKKPWAVAAAAALLLGVGGLAWGAKMEYNAAADPIILEAEEEKGKPAIQLAKEWEEKYKKKEQEVEARKKEIRSIVAGQDERLNWIKLSKYINECLPRPDTKNLNEKQKAAFGDKGLAAWNRLAAQNQAGKGGDAQAAGQEGMEDLTLVNLEAVNAMFTEDLTGYFGRLKEANKDLEEMPEEERKAPPTGAGWVVEIRGYTHHQRQRDFVVETFLDNLATKARKAGGEKPGEPPDPLNGKISHSIWYRSKAKKEARDFELINHSDLHYLITSKSLGKQKPGMAPITPPVLPGQPAPAANRREGWKPFGMTMSTYLPRGEEGEAHKPLAGSSEKITAEKGQFIRTEFIILFVWREPTFDDDRPVEVAPQTLPGRGAGKTVRQQPPPKAKE
jgi:type IV pilus assembly protein PilM